MNEINIDQDKTDVLCRKHGIKLLVLHGSYAKGTANERSDIDVGVLSEKKPDSKQYFAILKDFNGLFGDKFDPAFLNGAEPMICYQTVLHGRPIYERTRGDFNSYKIQSIARYQDTKKFRDLEKTYIKSAVGHNG